MTKWVRLDDDNNVIEIHTNDITAAYGDHSKEVPAVLEDVIEMAVSFSYDSDNSEFTTTNLDNIKDNLKNKLSEARYNYETGGIIDPDDNTNVILSDRLSQQAITGATLWLQANTAATVSFKVFNGWHDLSYADSISYKNKVYKHVQDCFTREKAVVDIIDAATGLTTLVTNYASAIDTGWPATSFHKSKIDANTSFDLSFKTLPGS